MLLQVAVLRGDVQQLNSILCLPCMSCAVNPPSPLSQPLPDISEWLYGGVTEIGNAPVHIWQMFDRQGGKTSTYTFYTTPDGSPVRCVGGWVFVCLCVC
jgi:hypothetical protein